MGCPACGSKYPRVANVPRQKKSLPIKYPSTQKPSKTTATPPAVPKKVDPNTAIGIMSIIANSMPK